MSGYVVSVCGFAGWHTGCRGLALAESLLCKHMQHALNSCVERNTNTIMHLLCQYAYKALVGEPYIHKHPPRKDMHVLSACFSVSLSLSPKPAILRLHRDIHGLTSSTLLFFASWLASSTTDEKLWREKATWLPLYNETWFINAA